MRRKAMVWRLLLPEHDADSLPGMDTINLMCTLAWMAASYRKHSLVAHGYHSAYEGRRKNDDLY
jgi:hypothetical protein